jgi:hypothetical protein
VLAVANGIHNTDRAALQTLEDDYCVGGAGGDSCQGSSSIIDTGTNSVPPNSGPTSTGWGPQIRTIAPCTYAPTYAEDRAAYAQTGRED